MTPLAPNFNVGCVLSLFFHDQGLEATNLVDAVNIEIGGSGGAAFDRRSLRIVSCLSFLFRVNHLCRVPQCLLQRADKVSI